MIEFNDADDQGKSTDERIELAGTLRRDNAAVHAGYVSSPVHQGLYGIAATYDYRWARLAGVFQAIERAGGGEETLVSIALDAEVDPQHSVRMALMSKQDQDDSNLDQLFVIIGGDHRFSEQYFVFAELFKKSTERSHPRTNQLWSAGFVSISENRMTVLRQSRHLSAKPEGIQTSPLQVETETHGPVID